MPPTDPNATLDAAQDPSEDTPADATEDTEQDATENTVDWQARYAEAQKVIARQGQELGMLRQSDDADEGDDAEEEDAEEPDEADAPPTRGNDRLERDSWQLAESIYGPESIKAYSNAATLLDRAATPADYVAAFEAYHEARLESAAKKARKAAPAQGGEPSQSRVDANRPDTGPRNDFDRQAEEALAKGNSLGWFQAQVRKVRGE